MFIAHDFVNSSARDVRCEASMITGSLWVLHASTDRS